MRFVIIALTDLTYRSRIGRDEKLRNREWVVRGPDNEGGVTRRHQDSLKTEESKKEDSRGFLFRGRGAGVSLGQTLLRSLKLVGH